MYYILQVSEYEDFHELVVNRVVERVTQAELEQDLEYFTIYWWRVRAVDAMSGNKSPWSEPCWFKITAEDVIFYHKIDRCDESSVANGCISEDVIGCLNSYIIYGSNIFGLQHELVTDYDYSCTIPEAQIGVGLCPTSGVAELAVTTCCPTSGADVRCTHYCTGTWVPDYECPDILFILTEDCDVLTTEDGRGLLE